MNVSHDSTHQPPRSTGGPRRWLRQVGAVVHVLAVVAMLACTGYAALAFIQAAAKREPQRLPSTMEDVDWGSPESSAYCLACHKPVGPAMAGLDVEHGHPQNVHLSDAQLQAVADMGTVVGLDQTLICISCHTLSERRAGRYMLADSLSGGSLCERCHPGHYARGTPHDLRASAPAERNRLGETADEGGPCSPCHLAHRYAREFQPCAHDPDGRCTTCHQIDACAEDHARMAMDHPEAHCLECHDPHDMSHGEFLKQPASDLCVTCHEGLADGALVGMHPLGPMDDPVPQALISAGADVPAGSHELTCLVCHSIHAGAYAPLLVLRPDSNELCLTCHDDKRGVEASPESVVPRHGASPILNSEQQEVVRQWETRVGPDNELLCVSCHRVHGSKSKMALLAFQPKYGETCGACHPRHDGVFGTSHDLRTNFPDEPNASGMTPAEYGACSACHLSHRFARPPAPAPGDPSGQCLTCHQADACGEQRMIDGVDHPETVCTDCHDPHERQHANYLAADQVTLCSACHADQARLVGGPHDSAQNIELWPEGSRAPGGACLSCHVPHGGARKDLFRARGAEPVGNHDDVCLVCHPDAGWGANSGIAAIHPHEISPTQDKVKLALVPKDDAGNMRMGCRTCHDPHGGVEPVHLARVALHQPTESLCLHCHEEKEYVKQTGHSADSLSRFGLDVDSCKPCHAMHASRDGLWGQMLSPRFLRDWCKGTEEMRGGRLPCLACHCPDGVAPLPQIVTHPDKEMFNMISPDAPGYLPLFDTAGHIHPAGRVVCRTCHLSHGRLDLLRRVAQRESLSRAEQSAIRTQVRPFVPPNICTECHGEEARMRFLFFHDPARRAFPRQDPGQ
ncbi:MAG: cytochrome c3 family protein [Phycisphaerae bacterium]|jgi:predicted CXXCH cytochrome family protein